MIKVIGRKEALGRPLLYGTTLEFMKQFGLKSLDELPRLEELLPPEESALAGAAAPVPAETAPVPEAPPAEPAG